MAEVAWRELCEPKNLSLPLQEDARFDAALDSLGHALPPHAPVTTPDDHVDALRLDCGHAVQSLLCDLGFDPPFEGYQGVPECSGTRGVLEEDGGIVDEALLKGLRSPVSTSTLLDTLARLALHPAATIAVALRFTPLMEDLAARWLSLIGFDGAVFARAQATRQQVLAVLSAVAAVMELSERLYPHLVVLLRHPLLSNDPFDLLEPRLPSATLAATACPPPTSSPANAELDIVFEHPDLVTVLLALHRILSCAPWLPHAPALPRWSRPPRRLLACMKRHPYVGVRLLAWRIVRKWTGSMSRMGDELRRKWVFASPADEVYSRDGPLPSVTLGGQDVVDYEQRLTRAPARLSADGGHRVEIGRYNADVWLLPIIEQRRVATLRAFRPHRRLEQAQLDVRELSPHVVFVAGRILLRELPADAVDIRSPLEPSIQGFVETESAMIACRSVVSQIVRRMPLLLSSAPAAGKSTLFRHLHRLFRGVSAAAPVVVNLANRSLDAKALLGSLASDPSSPGSFSFVEGALTRALRLGRWLILEDIDRANEDVLVLVSELADRIRSRALSFPGGGGGYGGAGPGSIGVEAGGRFVAADHGFLLLATRSTTSNAAASFFGAQFLTEIWLPSPSRSEAVEIVKGQFPRIQFPEVLVDIHFALQSVAAASTASSRTLGFRDLNRWARRVEDLLPSGIDIAKPTDNQVVADHIAAEACDIFMGSLPPTAETLHRSLCVVLAGHLSLGEERLEALCGDRKADLVLPPTGASAPSAPHTLRIGRTSLAAKSADPLTAIQGRPFAYTKQSTALLERVAVCARLAEPTLLVGETGCGKTTVVSQLASLINQPLISLNLSNQTEASDLLGGFKPLDGNTEAKRIAFELLEQFVQLFGQVFSLSRNAEFVNAVRTSADKGRWSRLVGLLREAGRMALAKLEPPSPGRGDGSRSPLKKRRIAEVGATADLTSHWNAFAERVTDFEQQHVFRSRSTRPAFAFVEGPLVRALREGHWLLLDEVNLAASETLEALSTLLSGPESSIVLTERGDIAPVPRHPDFRLFACMNPSTDVGKRDLPPALRACFTELYVPAPDADREALLAIVDGYLGHVAVGDRGLIADVADFYGAIKTLASNAQLADGLNQPPHYSMRTLTRALTFATSTHQSLGLRRAVVEGLLMTFTMSLDAKSVTAAHLLAERHLLGGRALSTLLSQPTAKPRHAQDAVQLDRYWLASGPVTPQMPADYVITPSVEGKVRALARVVLTRKLPVLIQGPTSSGKTSIVEYLAQRTGHRFVRINNHEHTDIQVRTRSSSQKVVRHAEKAQEYLGTYVSDPQTGKLVFQEGLLVRALRQGDWLVLDELNLAPSDVLEALNRLLDDNRELIIPETQEVVRPHPHFMLFATQNPPGLYAGRKALSRAFRNRFLELHFDDVPEDELKQILSERCRVAPSYAERIVKVFLELRRRRQAGRVFDERQAFATLRDLFRWGGRGAVGVQQLAEDGYMLLAERARSNEDKEVIKAAIQDVMRVVIDEQALYQQLNVAASSVGMVATPAMRRLYTLVDAALRHQEPVLLVGETGSGKTSVCQLIAQSSNSRLHAVNCHQGTDAADLLGGQRPVRDRAAVQASLLADATAFLASRGQPAPSANFDDVLAALEQLDGLDDEARTMLQGARKASALFDWHDGPLVEAMRSSDVFLLDEISLADNSVLERLNSVLEPGRTLVLAEKGGGELDNVRVVAEAGFRFVATMNPGGDFGKKELSPALRNRFTEIWVPAVAAHEELLEILHQRLAARHNWAAKLLSFRNWLLKGSSAHNVTLRTLLAWADFIRTAAVEPPIAFVHGGLMTVVDALVDVADVQTACRAKLHELAGVDAISIPSSPMQTASAFEIGLFGISRGSHVAPTAHFSFEAPTTRENAARVLRALQLSKPILLEGSPGVGKTTLVAALAAASGHRLERVNLSDQTDLADLFGSDLPVEDGQPGQFAWKNAAFLSAMQAGDWVLLDEMNLAPQPVLEGLNSCLDHRGEVFVPELARTFARHPDFRIFAAQNPLSQGGSRKGLPKSFVDRFTAVYMAELTMDDLHVVCRELAPASVSDALLDQLIGINTEISRLPLRYPSFGLDGAPWEFNLRDVQRWLTLLSTPSGLEVLPASVLEHLSLLYQQRFRTAQDRNLVRAACRYVLGIDVEEVLPGRAQIDSSFLQCGRSLFDRRESTSADCARVYLTASGAEALEALSTTLSRGWLAILVGPSRSGKSLTLHALARATGRTVHTVNMSAASDAMDLLGSFEQADRSSRLADLLPRLRIAVREAARNALVDDAGEGLLPLFAEVDCKLQEEAPDLSALANVLSQIPGLEDEARTTAAEADAKSGNRFRWVDGPLLRAMQAGDWLLIENANLCSSSVLDRLNSLCEPAGRIVLNERGQLADGSTPIVTPHPDFRLIMTLDPKYGELSRAMRNRGVEIFFEGGTTDLSLSLEDADLEALSAVSNTNAPKHFAMLTHALESVRASSVGLLARLQELDGRQQAATQTEQVWSRVAMTSLKIVGALLRLRGLPEGFAEAQPVQFLLNHHLSADIGSALSTTAPRAALLHQLSSLIALDEEIVFAEQSTQVPGRAHDAVIRQACFDNVKVVALWMLQALSEPRASHAALFELAAFSEHLRHLASQQHLDLSSMQQMVSLLESTASAVSLHLPDLEHIKAATRMRDGKVMARIWSTFLMPPFASDDAQQAFNLLLAALQLAWKSAAKDLRKLACEVLTALRVAAMNDANLAKTVGIARSVSETLATTTRSDNHDANLTTLAPACALIADLLALSSNAQLEPRHHSALASLAVQPSASLLITLDSRAHHTLSSSARVDVLARLVSRPDVVVEPADLLRPVQLTRGLQACLAITKGSLAALEQNQRTIDLAAASHYRLASISHGSRSAALWSLCRSIVEQIWGAIGSDHASAALQSDAFNGVGRSHLSYLQSLFQSASPSTHDLARAFVASAQLLWSLYVSDVPLDPAVGQQAQRKLWQRVEGQAMDALALHTLTMLPMRGAEGSLRSRMLLANLERARRRLDALAAPLVQREPDPATLSAIFGELRNATDTLFAADRLESLLTLCRAGDGADAQVETLCSSAASIQQRLATAFSSTFGDLLTPVQAALSLLIVGLNIAAFAGQAERLRGQHAAVVTTLHGIVAFPAVAAANAASESRLPVSFKSGPNAALSPAWSPLLRLLGQLEQRCRDQAVDLEKYAPLFDQVYQMWAVDRRRAEEAAQASAQEYRTRRSLHNEAGVDDVEADEMDFEEIFGERSADQPRAPTSSPRQLLLPEQLALVVAGHSSLFSPDKESDQRAFETIRDAVVDSILSQLGSALGEECDVAAGAYILSRIGQTSLTTNSTAVADFYRSSNVAESRRVLPVVHTLVKRLDVLIEEWPEQMILRQLRDRCDAILAIPVSAPVTRTLAHLENFLLAMDDWEAVASRDVSLVAHREQIVELIVSWRRLELSCWPALLDHEQSRFIEQVAEWWPRFYETVIRGAATLSQQSHDDATAFMRQLVELVDAFLAKGPVGQFAARLELAQTFAKHAAAASGQSVPAVRTLNAVARIMANVCGFYARFASTAADFVHNSRTKVEAQVKDVVKLASWRDVNVQALKQSAQKSHRALHKCIKAWRSALQKPVSDLFGDITPALQAAQPMLPIVEAARVETALSASSQDGPEYLRHLARTFERFNSVAISSDAVFAALHARSDALDNLSATIVSTADQLQKEQLPTDESKDRVFKALLTRKKRAWADLLKEMRRIGLSSNPNAALLARLRDSAHVYTVGREASVALQAIDEVDEVDAHFYRLTSILPRLRATPGAHHDDISPRDLQRALGSVESAFAAALDERRLLIETQHEAQRLQCTLGRLGSSLAVDQGLAKADNWRSLQERLIYTLHHLVKALEDILSRSVSDAKLADAEEPSSAVLLDLQRLVDQLRGDRDALGATPSLVPSAFALASELQIALLSQSHLQEAYVALQRLLDQAPGLRYLLQPTIAWLAGQLAPASDQPKPPEDAEFVVKASTAVLAALLVIVQELNVEVAEAGDELEDGAIPTIDAAFRSSAAKLHAARVAHLVDDFATSLTQGDAAIAESHVARCWPFLERYFTALRSHIVAHAAWIKSQFRFAFVVASVTLTLAEKGFCKPSEADKAAGQPTSGDGETAEGTGMGSGQGQKNVSNEIEGQEQLEGLAGEDEEELDADDGASGEKGEKGAKEDDDAFDVEDDFAGGKTEDAGSQGEEEEEASGNQQDDDQEPDDQVGDVDPLDASAVDEKFWSGQDEERERQEAGEEMAQDAQQDAAPEMTAGQDDKAQARSEQPTDAEQAEQGEADEPEGDVVDDKKPDQVDMPAGENLEETGEGEAEAERDADEALDLDDDMELPDDGPEQDGADNMPSDVEGADEPDAGDLDDAMEGLEEPAQPDDQPAEGDDPLVAPSTEQGTGEADTEGGAGSMGLEQPDTDAKGNAAADAQAAAPSADDQAMQEDAAAEAQQADGQSGTRAPAPDSAGRGQAEPDATEAEADRTLGDANEAWQRRLDEILAASQDDRAARTTQDAPETSQVEHVRDDQAAEEQAMGPASEEQSRQTDRLAVDNANEAPERPLDDDEDMQVDPAISSAQGPLSVDVGQAQSRDIEQPAFASTQTHADERTDAMDVDQGAAAAEQHEPSPEPEVDAAAIEQELVRWQTGGDDALDATDVWRLYKSHSRAACFRLTEQLRLILEPTQATRLQGDYRSGKRLNMKRIIPYIASDFTKDKIWLRRTRPSAREYQILLALDDSKSMADSHSVHLAYQALALVSGALGRLEVGEVSVVRFGSDVDVVVPFTGAALQDDNSGAELLRRFTFAQRQTDLARLLEDSLQQLADARAQRRSGSSGSDLWQLMVIISDGLCQDQERLRALLRKAYQSRVMVVFIVVDSLHQRAESSSAAENSILSMKSVSYVQGAGGKLEMRVDRYMDTFPFEYYVVLRDADALSDTLSGLLRQFFERVAGSS